MGSTSLLVALVGSAFDIAAIYTVFQYNFLLSIVKVDVVFPSQKLVHKMFHAFCFARRIVFLPSFHLAK